MSEASKDVVEKYLPGMKRKAERDEDKRDKRDKSLKC